MNEIFFWVVLVVFGVATATLAVYGLHLYVLLVLFRRRKGEKCETQSSVIESFLRNSDRESWPVVTSQIPIYNEADVAVRVIRAVAAMDYPAAKHEIQVLDDSTDHTRVLIDGVARELQSAGIDVRVVRRPTREGYKAGALAHGLAMARGQYVAVFDADFVPPAGFLHKAVPLLEEDEGIACMQGRWEHLNQDESWLTKAQALGIDGHFAIEQGARAWNGLMMNFNGTAGVWRKSAIDDPAVGGWSGDTLTEDLDLSYRAQLAGWRIDYCLEMGCPAELPGTISALKSQQRRWATGSIQVAVKLLPRIWRAKLSFAQKLEAALHLTHYSVALWMLLLALVARPMLLVFDEGRLFSHDTFWVAWSFILFAAFAPSLVYAYARYSLGGRWSGFRVIPSMFVLGCGLCVNNTIAVVRGLYLHGGEFVRTPKSGSDANQAQRSSYATMQGQMWIIELALGIYSAISFVIYFTQYSRAFSFFLFMYAVGFTVVGWMSRPRREHVTLDRPAPVVGLLGSNIPATDPSASP